MKSVLFSSRLVHTRSADGTAWPRHIHTHAYIQPCRPIRSKAGKRKGEERNQLWNPGKKSCFSCLLYWNRRLPRGALILAVVPPLFLSPMDGRRENRPNGCVDVVVVCECMMIWNRGTLLSAWMCALLYDMVNWIWLMLRAQSVCASFSPIRCGGSGSGVFIGCFVCRNHYIAIVNPGDHWDVFMLFDILIGFGCMAER